MGESIEPGTCKACGDKSDSDGLCFECDQAGLLPAMTPRQMLRHVLEHASRVENDHEGLLERQEASDALLRTVEAWHKARSVACRDDRMLEHSEADLRDACRSHFEH